MKIRVLGSGCARCRKLEERIRHLIAENRLPLEVEKVTDIQEIMKYGIMMMPGLVIDGVLKSVGSIPKDDQLLAWMKGVSR
ncbi:MAG: thioredoxin family protein [Bacteroidota bacterium]